MQPKRKEGIELLSHPHKTLTKPWQIMLMVMLSIIIVEAVVMLLFTVLPLPHLSVYELAALDALLLGIITAPALYFFLLLPLQRQAINEQKTHFSMYDMLTGLPRRELFSELVEHEISKARRQPYSAALIVIDPRRLSETNQIFGYMIGDGILTQLAERLQSSLRESDLVSRLSGDEFGVLLPCADIDTLNIVMVKINNALEEPFNVTGVDIDIDVVMGVAIFPDHADSASDLIRRANMARNIAKQEKISYAIYDAQEESASHQRLVTFNQLRSAIKAEELELYYQPKIHLDSGKVAGVEALARWTGEHGKPPSVFIPLAEQTGLIKEITRWVIKKAVNQCSEWKKIGLLIPVSINISSRDLYDSSVISFFNQCVNDKSLPHSLITIEVTESGVMRHPELAIELLSQLKRDGFKISIDDFGTGYSSLAYLKSLPATELKIDQSFIANILSDKKDEILVKSTITLAKNLGLQVVIEGVETESVVEKLRTFGPDILQGYYYSRPLNSDDYTQWHQQWSAPCIK